MLFKFKIILLAFILIHYGCQKNEAQEQVELKTSQTIGKKNKNNSTKINETKTSKPNFLTAKEAKETAEKLFENESSRLIESNPDASEIDVMSSHLGDFTGDGGVDVAVFYSLSPQGGGNAIIEQGLMLYQNTNNSMVLIDKIVPNYLFFVAKIANTTIYLEKMEYAEEDGRCCPSIRSEVIIKIDRQKIK